MSGSGSLKTQENINDEKIIKEKTLEDQDILRQMHDLLEKILAELKILTGEP